MITYTATPDAVGDSLALTPPPYGGTGGSFDGEEPDFEASLTAETATTR